MRMIRFLLCLGALGCHQGDAGSLESLTLGVSTLGISLPVFVAAERGLFARHDLTVKLRTFDTAQPMADAVARGELDAGGYVAYPIAFLSSEKADEPPMFATSVVEDHAHRLSYVLARPFASRRFPQDAAGTRIGILPTVAYQRWLAAILSEARIDASLVTVVPVAPALQAQTLAAGGIDFLFTNDPMATHILAGKIGVLADDGPPCAARLANPFHFGTFMISGRLAAGRPETARRLVAAIDEAISLIRADPDGARLAMLPYVRQDQRPFATKSPVPAFLTANDAREILPKVMQRERGFGSIARDPPARAP